jgi:hypothetical protein
MRKVFVLLTLGAALGFLAGMVLSVNAEPPAPSQVPPKLLEDMRKMEAMIRQEEMAEARLKGIEDRLAKAQQDLAQVQARLAQDEQKLASITLSFQKHTHKYELSYLGGAWPLPTLKQHLNDSGYVVHVINTGNVPSGPPTASTGKPEY